MSQSFENILLHKNSTIREQSLEAAFNVNNQFHVFIKVNWHLSVVKASQETRNTKQHTCDCALKELNPGHLDYEPQIKLTHVYI